jgi:hypothetical protein
MITTGNLSKKQNAAEEKEGNKPCSDDETAA